MTAVELEHPTGSVLTAYSLGELGESELAGIDAHLAECEVCRQVVEGVAPDTLVALLRSADTDVVKSEAPKGATPPAALNGHPRYRVGELLGVGGMGVVYKAEHLLMERPVALKVLNRDLIDRPATLERFRREVRAAARLTHPNIVAAYDAEQVDDVHFLVMEYVEGVSLSRRSAEHGPLPVAEACDYIRQAALGLQHAHECGMVHRDIKPQNLMLTPNGQVKILDFGLARFVSEGRGAWDEGREKSGEGRVASGEEIQEATPDADQSSGILNSSPLATRASPLITDTGLTMGTPDYIAPEQARDSRVADIRADIYSLGCTLYDLLAGHAPFPDGNATQKVKAHLERTPVPLRSLRRDVPVELARVVERMMAKDPAGRYQTPAEVAAALGRFVKPKPPSRKRWLGLAAAFGFVAALVAGVIIYVQTDHGTITVETNDDKIAVMIEKAGGVKIIDKTNNREYSLRPGAQEVPGGDYQIEVSEALAGLDFQTKEFKLRRGKEVRLTAKFGAKGEGQLGSGAIGVDRKRREERLKGMREIAAVLEAQHKAGVTSFESVIQAKRALAKAQVELAVSQREKLKALESLAALTQSLVDVRKNLFEVGKGTQVDVLQAQAELLEAQGALEREKNRVPTQASAKEGGPLYGGKPASYWLDQLQDANATFRVQAVNALGELTQKKKTLIAVLVSALNDKSSSVATRAIWALGRLGPDALPNLIEVLKEKKSPTLLARAAAAIGHVGPQAKTAVPLLMQMLKSSDWGVRASAISALGGIGADAKAALPGIVEIYGNYLENGPKNIENRTDNRFDRSNGVDFTGLVYEEVSRIDPSLVDAMTKHLGNTSFPHSGNSTYEWPRFYNFLKKRYPAGADASLPGGQNAGPESFMYLAKPANFWLEQRNGPDVLHRVEAVAALGFIAQKHKEFIPILAASLSDNSYEVAQAASLALSDLGPQSIPALSAALDETVKNRSAGTFRYAANALGRIGPEAKEVVPTLAKALKQNEWGVHEGLHYASIHALGQIGPAAKTALPEMIDAFRENLKSAESKKGKTNGARPTSAGPFLRNVVESLKQIDPDVRAVLPKALYDDGVFREGVARDWDESMKLWQETYEALKKKYPPPL